MPLNIVLRRFAFYCHNIVLLKKQAPELSEACFVSICICFRITLYSLFCEARHQFCPQD